MNKFWREKTNSSLSSSDENEGYDIRLELDL